MTTLRTAKCHGGPYDGCTVRTPAGWTEIGLGPPDDQGRVEIYEVKGTWASYIGKRRSRRFRIDREAT